jgi:pectin methylesterase-like acyl-CoA thioesterase
MTRLLLVAVALVVWIAAAGVGAGATWDMYQGGSIQATVDTASPGDTIYVHEGTYVENVDVWKQITLIGDGADVCGC